jgi:hypothetical protein
MPQEHCASCGGEGNPDVNPLDCGARFLSCENPCRVGDKNSAQCETLPSQIENFTLQFFGTVVKTEVDGIVTWSLPCSLDIGLPNNPRGIDEGLACYFLRLFRDGIVGLTGPQGIPGGNGTNGNNAYTVTLHSFVQPSIAVPVVQVVTQFNPAIIAGIYVNISNSGWYQVNETDGNGVLLLTLIKPAIGASGTIPAGKLVVPSGIPGASVTGPQGPQGPTGPQGPSGTQFTTTNGMYYALVGTDFNLPLVYTQVDFVNSAPNILLPVAGLYLVTVVADIVGQAGVLTTDTATLKLRNVSFNADVPGSEHGRSGMVAGEVNQIVINVRLETDAANQTVALFGKCSTDSKIAVQALHTTVSYVKIA